MAPNLGKRPRRARGRILRATAILTMTLAAACGKGEEAAPREPGPEPPATLDTVPPPVEGVEPAALPPDFPSDLPIPPGATLTRVETRPDETGTAASASLVTTADADDTLSWYASALADAGWEVEEVPGGVQAVQGESWVEIGARVRSPDRTEIELRAWKTGR